MKEIIALRFDFAKLQSTVFPKGSQWDKTAAFPEGTTMLRPLCHLSGAKITLQVKSAKLILSFTKQVK